MENYYFQQLALTPVSFIIRIFRIFQSNLKWLLSIATIIHLIVFKHYHYFQRLLSTFPEHTQLLVERFGG